jgi:hypothetical protein
LTEASTAVGRKRYDDEGALLRFAKSHSPTTPLAIVDAIHRLLAGLGSGAETTRPCWAWVWGESEPYVVRAERARVAAKCAGTHASW